MNKRKLLLCLGTLSSLIAVNPAISQTQSTLAIQSYPGLTITGAVGTVYAIQATTNLLKTNAWTSLTFVQLPATNYLWLDTSARTDGQRFYRIVASTPTNMAFIPPGNFRMGSPTNEVRSEERRVGKEWRYRRS